VEYWPAVVIHYLGAFPPSGNENISWLAEKST
jgi:hypothetical protein